MDNRLVNTASVARMLGVKPSDIGPHLAHRDFPTAVAAQRGDLLWLEGDVLAYAARRGLRPAERKGVST